MQSHRTGGRMGLAATACVALISAPALWASAGTVNMDAFSYAFRFASAIVSDEKDRAASQESVLQDLAEAGHEQEALSKVEQIEGWRRGVVYADLATRLAADGDKTGANDLIHKAQEVAASTEGWQKERIQAQLAQAMAAVGNTAMAGTMASAVASSDPRQYAARSTATMASSTATEKGFDEAMQRLDSMSSDTDLETSWWRTVGYASMARRADLPRDQRMKALAAARKSADSLSGWKRAEALESIANEYHKQGDDKSARECLQAADALLMQLPDTVPIKAALLSNLARDWVTMGERQRARELVAQAEAVVPRAPLIDRPALYANVATSYAALNDDPATRRLYDKALQETEGLVNARPRALAAVAVCRSMGRQGQELDGATRGRLDALLAGLKDPW